MLSDDDPRVVARRQQARGSSGTTGNAQRSGNVGTVQGIHSSAGSTDSRQTGGQQQGPDGVLAPVARALGIEGREFAFPVQLTNLLGMQGEQRIPLVQAVLGGLVLFYLLFLR